MTTSNPEAIVRPAGFSHVRLTVTDIARSKAFYERLFGVAPTVDFSDRAGEPEVRADPESLYGGCVFTVGDSQFGLRPVATAGDVFRSTRTGLDHLSFQLTTTAELHRAAELLDQAGIEHGEVKELGNLGVVILSVQDPDDINLEVAAALGS